MLNPEMQEEGEYIWDHLSKKYGSNAKKRFGGANSYLNQAGREVGIHFNSERFINPTIRALALMEYVKNADNEKANMMMVEMYRAYFEEGVNINDAVVLRRITEKTLQDDHDQVNEAMNAMESQSFRNQVMSKDRKAKYEMNVHGVPYFIIERNDSKASIEFSGAQPLEIIAEQLEIAAEDE